MDKLQCYKKLFELRDHYHVDVSAYLTKLAGTNTVDKSIVDFISNYESPRSLNESAIRDIYNRRNKNPLYKSLVNESASIEEKLIALSSYVTRALIDSKSMNESDRQKFLLEMKVLRINEAISNYLSGNQQSMLSEFDELRSMIKSIINESEVKIDG